MAGKKAPSTPRPKRAFGRSLADFGELLPAEIILIEAACIGEWIQVRDGLRPKRKSKYNVIRPEIVRFLVLGGDENNPVHERGIWLKGAWINGAIDLQSCNCLVPLWIVNCEVEGDVILQDTKLPVLSLQGSRIRSLHGDDFTVAGSLFLRDGFKALGVVRLLGARIDGNLTCSASEMGHEKGDALVCDGIVVKGNVFLNARFKSYGRVRFPVAQIGGNLDCSNSEFTSETDYAVNCDGMTLGGSVFLNAGFKAAGGARLLGAKIGGILACGNGEFTANEDYALACDGIEVNESVFLHHGFKAAGGTRLLGANIGGNLDCTGGEFVSETHDALNFDGSTVKRSVHLINGFKAIGIVRLVGAQIGGELACHRGEFAVREGPALICQGASITGTIRLQDRVPGGAIDLIATQAGSLHDNADCWFEGTVLDGFQYDRIVGSAPTDAAMRIAWLKKQPDSHLRDDFKPQPWEQLIKVLREMGHEDDAKTVAMAKQDALRAAGKIKGFAKPLHWLYGRLAGYGHRPLWTVAWMALVWVIATGVYEWSANSGLMAPTSAIVQTNPKIADVCGLSDERRETRWTDCPALPQEYTTFSSILYSLDLILPLVDLQQDSDWAPIVIKDDGKTRIWPGVIVRWVMWFEILFGWMASLLLVAVLGNLVKKD